MKETVTDFEVGERLDKVLAVTYPQYSRSALEKLVAQGDVLVNDRPAKTRYRLKEGDLVSVDLALFNQAPPDIELAVLYEDNDVVVLNKPAGVLTHAKGTLHNEATVATWLKQHYGDDTEFWSTNRAGVVHRLDRGTSGIIICAKHEIAQVHLQKQFANRNVKKTYIALIAGELPKQEGLIDVPIERNPKKPASFRPGANGKSAQTNFKTLESNGKYSLVELKPYTGRTHQLRVHLDYLKHPIVGDMLYDGKPASRMMLHATSLELTLPSKERKTFFVQLPKEFSELLHGD